MPYDENLANRIRQSLAHLPNVSEKKMFGSLAFMVDDKMCVTAGPDAMMCRIDPAIHEEVVKNKNCHAVIMRGREYKGYVRVVGDILKSKKEFNSWIRLALDFNKFAKASKKIRTD
ncbi:MAG: TfoX/Sxy family protein [Ginsengibacter sp.]